MHFNLISSSRSFLRSAGDMAFSGPVPSRILVATERGLGLLFISQQRFWIFAHARKVLLGSQQLEANEYRQSLGSIYCLTKVKEMFV